jgi:hypothetical protein
MASGEEEGLFDFLPEQAAPERVGGGCRGSDLPSACKRDGARSAERVNDFETAQC